MHTCNSPNEFNQVGSEQIRLLRLRLDCRCARWRKFPIDRTSRLLEGSERVKGKSRWVWTNMRANQTSLRLVGRQSQG